MELDLYQIDAFSSGPFTGNPAAVVFSEEWLPPATMQKIASENALAETAFIRARGIDYQIRWFTPEIEMDLCGHATLAAAFALRQYRQHENSTVNFSSISGELKVNIQDDLYTLDFPSRPAVATNCPQIILQGINSEPVLTLKARDYILVYDHEQTIKELRVDPAVLNQINIDPGAVVVTAPGTSVDFVSRVFTPQATIFEDPATGSTHCSLIPYWSRRLNKNRLAAQQLSARKGYFQCEDGGDRVLISGRCHPYLVAKIHI